MITDALILRESQQYDKEVITRLRLERLTPSLCRIDNALDACTSLIDLSLAWNEISSMKGLGALVTLQRLDLSHNFISKIEDVSNLTSLEYLDLRANRISSLDENVVELLPLTSLKSLLFRDPTGQDANPICANPKYESTLLQAMPTLTALDGGHVGIIEMSDMLFKQLKNIKPDDQIQVPAPKSWFSSQDLHVDGVDEGNGDNDDDDDGTQMGGKTAKLLENYNESHKLLQSSKELLQQADLVLEKHK